MVTGLVAMEDVRNYYIDLGRTQGILPKSDIIPGETIKMGSSIKVYITRLRTILRVRLFCFQESIMDLLKAFRT